MYKSVFAQRADVIFETVRESQRSFQSKGDSLEEKSEKKERESSLNPSTTKATNEHSNRNESFKQLSAHKVYQLIARFVDHINPIVKGFSISAVKGLSKFIPQYAILPLRLRKHHRDVPRTLHAQTPLRCSLSAGHTSTPPGGARY